MKLLHSVLFAAVVGVAVLPAQTPAPAAPAQPRPRTSPHETVSRSVDGNRVMLVYGRPYTKDPKTGEPRKIWGGLVPYGKVWRCGADEATLFLTQQPLVLGGAKVPAGAYTLYVLPSEDGSTQLLISHRLGQWGADPYIEQAELARVELKREALAVPVEQFTMAVEKDSAGGGVLRLMWENMQFSVPFTLAK